MANTDYDHAARKAARLDPEGFFGWLLTDFAAWLRFDRWLDTRTTPTPGARETTGDTVAEPSSLRKSEPPFLFPVEFQTTPDSHMFGRLLRELGQFWEDHRPDPHRGSRYQLGAAVVNLTGTRQSMPASHVFHVPGPDGVYCGLKVRERHVQEESADRTLEAIAAGAVSRVMLVFVPLMQGAGEAALIRRWLELATEPDSYRRREFGSLALVMAGLKDWYPAWEQALRRWEMHESKVVNEWRREGAVQASRQNLKSVLKERFGSLPVGLIERIDAVADSDLLNQVIALAARVERLDDLTI